jgi:integrase
LKWIENLLENKGTKDSDFEAEAENLLGIDLYEREEKVVQTPNRSIQSVSGANCVLETIESYLNWKRLEKTAERTIWEKKAVIEEFFEITELEFMEQVSKEVIRNYITIQSKLPLNRKKNPKYRNKTISQILEMQNVEVQGVNNINKKLTVLTAFGNWSEKNGFLNQNLFSGMKLDAKKAGAVERENFTDQDLKKILNPQTYLSSTIQGISSVTKKPISNREAYYWIFLLGIFSGMRTNEMTQLRLDDFQQIDGVWMIQVDETEETRVKTRNSIRKVPVHPKLIELGILDYIQKLRKQKQDRFFWELKMVRGKYGKEVSRFYNEKYLKEVGVWKQTVKVLYCTRHTLIHNLYRKGVDENVIKTLVGHEKEFTMKHYGGNPYDAENLLNEISKVEYSSVDFGSLKVDWKRVR